MSSIQRTKSPVGKIIHSRAPPSEGAGHKERLTCLLLNWLQEDHQGTSELRACIFANMSTEESFLEVDMPPASSPRVQALNEASIDHVTLGITVNKTSYPGTQTGDRYLHLSAFARGVDAGKIFVHGSVEINTGDLNSSYENMSFSDALDMLRVGSKMKCNWFGEFRSTEESEVVRAELRERFGAHIEAT